MAAAVEMRGITKKFGDFTANDNINFQVEWAQIHGICGENGAGKTTLMNIIGCLDGPTSGEYWLEGQDISGLGDAKMSEVRLHSIGFVFQSFYLLSRQSALENVALPLLYAGVRRRERQEIARRALERAMEPFYREVSGGRMGMGLHICKLLCERHGGDLSICNNAKGGGLVCASFAFQGPLLKK